jgi:lipoprotein-anchoring transpeptidase ErfK/SrfK
MLVAALVVAAIETAASGSAVATTAPPAGAAAIVPLVTSIAPTAVRSPRVPLSAANARATARSRTPERDERPLVVHVDRPLAITARPGGGRTIGTMPTGSRFYHTPIVAWVREISRDGRFGLVTVPYVAGDRSGWISLRGLETAHTTISVDADLSEHRITVRRGEEVVLRAAAATGSGSSPTPSGHYFVTDRVPFPSGGVLGTFAFGISGIQPNLPAGWSGGDQLAIHGTNDPSSIGTSASAGCLRVSAGTLSRLRPLLRLGTPVVIHA